MKTMKVFLLGLLSLWIGIVSMIVLVYVKPWPEGNITLGQVMGVITGIVDIGLVYVLTR